MDPLVEKAVQPLLASLSTDIAKSTVQKNKGNTSAMEDGFGSGSRDKRR